MLCHSYYCRHRKCSDACKQYKLYLTRLKRHCKCCVLENCNLCNMMKSIAENGPPLKTAADKNKIAQLSVQIMRHVKVCTSPSNCSLCELVKEYTLIKKTRDQFIKCQIARLNSEEEKEIICPLTHEPFTDPVTSIVCGHSFDRSNIMTWLKTSNTCPTCREHLTAKDLESNYAIRQHIQPRRLRSSPNPTSGPKRL